MASYVRLTPTEPSPAFLTRTRPATLMPTFTPTLTPGRIPRPTHWPGDAQKRLRTSRARRRIRAHAYRDRYALLRSTASAIALRAFAPTMRWRRHVLGHLRAGPATALYLAVLCGCAWPCPLARSGDAAYAERACSLCGGRPSTLPVELDLHCFDFFATAGCPGAAGPRQAHRDRLRAAYDEAGAGACFAAAAALAPRFRLAFLLGSPRLFPAFVARLFPGRGGPEQRGPGRMPESLQAASITAFTLAWGDFTARHRPRPTQAA